MKTINLSVLSLLIVVVFNTLSCRNEFNTSNDFLILIDSVRMPDSVISASDFELEFFGTIGFDDCNSFKTFTERIENNDITIEAWGTFDNYNHECQPALVTLNGQKLNLRIPFPGTYKIIIKEPAEFILVKRIIVN